MIISAEQLVHLKKLKEIDHSIRTYQLNKKEAPNLIAKLEKKVAAALAAQEESNAVFEEMQTAHMQVEEDIKSNNDSLVRAKEKLQKITNDTEFKAATKEVEQYKAMVKKKTKELPVAAEQMRLAKEELETKVLLFKAAEEERGACPTDIDDIIKSLDKNINEKNKARQEVTSGIEKTALAIYEKTLANGGGLALVPAEGGGCSACKMKIRPQLYNEILKGNVRECETCKRMLYAN